MLALARPLQRLAIALSLAALMAAGPAPIAAQQVETVAPTLVIDGDLDGAQAAPAYSTNSGELPAVPASETPASRVAYNDIDSDLQPQPGFSNSSPNAQQATAAVEAEQAAAGSGATYQEDDLVGAAETVFGKGARGLAGVIEDILKKQGEPNGYIVGREGGGAFVLGARYGSGTLYHKIEGQQPVYWRGPSLGIDAGANAANTFVLVYNLYDTDDLFKTYGQGEGQAYLIGGFHVSYLRRNDVVLVPVRVGAGLRLGLNVGYMKFSHKQKWLPF